MTVRRKPHGFFNNKKENIMNTTIKMTKRNNVKIGTFSLNQQGILTILILGQHGVVGDMRSEVDLSYLSDTIMLFRFFESKGQVLKALSVVKSRTSAHEQTIREFRLTSNGIEVGHPLTDFEGVLSGVPSYRGNIPMLGASSD